MTARFDFSGKNALVTGAGKGIGRDIVKDLWQAGAKVTAVSRTQSDLDSLQAEYPGINIVKADLGKWKETQTALTKCHDIDLVVNNAGVFRPSTVLESTEDAVDGNFDINVKGLINVTQVLAKKMVERKKGKCFSISNIIQDIFYVTISVNSCCSIKKSTMHYKYFNYLNKTGTNVFTISTTI